MFDGLDEELDEDLSNAARAYAQNTTVAVRLQKLRARLEVVGFVLEQEIGRMLIEVRMTVMSYMCVADLAPIGQTFIGISVIHQSMYSVCTPPPLFCTPQPFFVRRHLCFVRRHLCFVRRHLYFVRRHLCFVRRHFFLYAATFFCTPPPFFYHRARHPQGTPHMRPPDKKTILRMLHYGVKLNWFQWVQMPSVQNKGDVGLVLPVGVEVNPDLQKRIEVCWGCVYCCTLVCVL